MPKKQIRITSVLLLLFLVAWGGWMYQHHKLQEYHAGETIATGQLRDTAFSLVSSAENSTTNYHQQYRYIEDIGDGRGYTAGIIGFTTRTGDLRQVVLEYQKLSRKNRLVKYLPSLKKVQGSASHEGLGKNFVHDWQKAAQDKKFVEAQNIVLDQQYLKPALKAARADNLGPLGQYIYYDAIVVHGPGNDPDSFGGIRKKARRLANSPIEGINQGVYLMTFLQVRAKVMRKEKAHQDLSRLNVQEKLIKKHDYNLARPITWKMYGDKYHLK